MRQNKFYQNPTGRVTAIPKVNCSEKNVGYSSHELFKIEVTKRIFSKIVRRIMPTLGITG